jgi:hypothetical protein
MLEATQNPDTPGGNSMSTQQPKTQRAGPRFRSVRSCDGETARADHEDQWTERYLLCQHLVDPHLRLRERNSRPPAGSSAT